MAYSALIVESIHHLWLGKFATYFATCIVKIINLYQNNKLWLLWLSRSWINPPNYNYYPFLPLPWKLASTFSVIKSLVKAYSHLTNFLVLTHTISCRIYCRIYGSKTSQNRCMHVQCSALYHQHTWFQPLTRKKTFRSMIRNLSL